MKLTQKQKFRSMEQNRKPRDKPMHLCIFYKGGKNIYTTEKTASSISGARKIG